MYRRAKSDIWAEESYDFNFFEKRHYNRTESNSSSRRA